MSRFWVEKVTELQPYVPGEQPATGSVVKLNTNEHALSPSDAVMAAISAVQGEQLRRYPDPAASGLCDAIAAVEGLTAACVFPGNGSDEVLAHLWFAFYPVEPSAPSIQPTVFILCGPSCMARS